VSNSENSSRLRSRLRKAGIHALALDAAWPKWWSEEADASPSARAELRFSIARKLGLEPQSLLDDGAEPAFVWKDEARFKHLTTEEEQEKAALASFGIALAAVLSSANRTVGALYGLPALSLRESILSGRQPFVALVDLLSVSWALGVSVVHLRVFPSAQKRMAAMAVRSRSGFSVLLGKDSMYPPQVAFYLAHELGHVALGHLAADSAIVDLEDEQHAGPTDNEEEAADRYALELLTGSPAPVVLPSKGSYSAKELARVSNAAAADLRIEPGTLALCFGYATRDWATTNAAMPHIYTEQKPVWREVNQVASAQLDLSGLPEDYRDYLSAVLGEDATQ
jgi:hypothetical protein